MNGEKMAKKAKRILVTVFFSITVIMAIIIGIILFIKNSVKNDYKEVPAVVVDTWNGNNSYTVIEYEWENEKYTRKLSVYSSSYYVGKEIDVYINPEKPGNPEMLLGYNIAIMVLAILGGSFLIVSLCIGIFFGRKNKKLDKLKITGRRIFAKIESVDLNWNVTIMNRHPFVITCSWHNTADGKVYHFRSQNLWDDPSVAIEQMKIENLPVYIDEKNVRRYAVDVEQLLAGSFSGEHVYL